jgi:hypothetical protein
VLCWVSLIERVEEIQSLSCPEPGDRRRLHQHLYLQRGAAQRLDALILFTRWHSSGWSSTTRTKGNRVISFELRTTAELMPQPRQSTRTTATSVHPNLLNRGTHGIYKPVESHFSNSSSRSTAPPLVEAELTGSRGHLFVPCSNSSIAPSSNCRAFTQFPPLLRIATSSPS